MLKIIAVALLSPALIFSQGVYGRRTRGPLTNPGGYDGPAVTFRGNLKAISKKELRIDADSEQQSLTFRITRKTHFFKAGKEIKLSDVTVGTLVAVDAVRDPDQQFSALNVTVNPPPKPETPAPETPAPEPAPK